MAPGATVVKNEVRTFKKRWEKGSFKAPLGGCRPQTPLFIPAVFEALSPLPPEGPGEDPDRYFP